MKQFGFFQQNTICQKKDLTYFLIQILRHKEWPDKKIIELKRSGTPKLCWADQIKFEFGGHFGGKKPKT